jgi:hypothetical protein
MIEILLLVIFVEALTEILVESSIFERPRLYLAGKSGFLGELIHCGYCTSVWVSFGVAWIAPLAISGFFWLNYFLTAFILHRMSNMLHELISKWLGRRPVTFAVHKTEAVILPNMEEPDEETAE